MYYIKTQNPNIPKLKNETKTVYKNILQNGSKDHIIFGKTLWKNKINNLDFGKIWKNTYCSYSQPHTSNLVFKLLHYATKTNHYTYKSSRDKTNLDPNCNYCNKTEDNLHLLTSGHRIQNTWKHFQSIYQKLTKKHHTPQQHIIILSSNNNDSKCKKLIL